MDKNPKNFWQSLMTVADPIYIARDIYIANLSVRLSVRHVLVLDENGLTYCHIFFHYTVAQSF